MEQEVLAPSLLHAAQQVRNAPPPPPSPDAGDSAGSSGAFVTVAAAPAEPPLLPRGRLTARHCGLLMRDRLAPGCGLVGSRWVSLACATCRKLLKVMSRDWKSPLRLNANQVRLV